MFDKYTSDALDCPNGQFGKDCMNSCSENCIETSRCDRFTGQCEGGCKPGWTGTTCVIGKYHHFLYVCNAYNFNSTNYTLITLMNAR